MFAPDDPTRYQDLVHDLSTSDWFMVAADFDSYMATQRRIDSVYQTSAIWTQKAILNTANMGWFSSDRTIREYAADIWGMI